MMRIISTGEKIRTQCLITKRLIEIKGRIRENKKQLSRALVKEREKENDIKGERRKIIIIQREKEASF